MEKTDKNQHSSKKAQYKIIKQIGHGASGIAYLLKNTLTNEKAVLKQIQLSTIDEKEYGKVLGEFNLLKKVNHPNIIRFLEAFKTTKPIPSVNIITEYAECGDLFQELELMKKLNKKFTEQELMDWLIQTCQGLKYLHSIHVIHRDIKPQNIFLTKQRRIKIGDLGVAKTLESTLQFAQTVVGTPLYISPEIINGEKYSFKTDMWSLGVTFYQLMSGGTLPFVAKNVPATILLISEGKYEKIYDDFYSQKFKDLIYELLNIDVNKRPSASEILEKEIIKKRMRDYLNENNFNLKASITFIDNFRKENQIKINKKIIEPKQQSLHSEKTTGNVKIGGHKFSIKDTFGKNQNLMKILPSKEQRHASDNKITNVVFHKHEEEMNEKKKEQSNKCFDDKSNISNISSNYNDNKINVETDSNISTKVTNDTNLGQNKIVYKSKDSMEVELAVNNIYEIPQRHNKMNEEYEKHMYMKLINSNINDTEQNKNNDEFEEEDMHEC